MKKHILITGASGLIGLELCHAFLDEGFHVYGFDLKPSSLNHPEYTYLKGDISKEADVKRAFGKIKSLDALINNAAKASPTNKKLEKLQLKEWNNLLAVDLTSVFLFSKYAIPLLRKSEGVILNTSSSRHKMSEPDTEIYSTAKGGIDALTRAMAISLGPEIRVNSISPGWIADPSKKLKKSDHDQHPVGRVGTPADIAGCAVYLVSEKAGFITGQDFVIDGGMTVKMIYKD
jgi:NAD(P)-dependent dehydrogenase (short-subunit alcohol dehydrogenase family)